jgi:C-terminal processing protease CtpA/Prc
MHQNFAVRLASGAIALLVAVSVGIAQEQADPAKEKTAEQTQKERQEARQELRDKQQEAREKIQQKNEEAREKIQQNRQDARDSNQQGRQDLRQDRRDADNRNERQGAREQVRDSRDSTRETRRDMRDINRDERQGTRDTRQDARQDARPGARQRMETFFRGRMNDMGVQWDDQRNDRLVVLNLDDDSPGARIGLRRGDVILSVNNRNVRTGDDFNRWISDNPGQAGAIMIQRNGRQYSLQLPWAEQGRTYGGTQSRTYLGVAFDPHYREFAVIREVKSGSPAEKIGLQPGDTLTHIDNQEVRSLQHALQLIAMMPAGEEFDLEYDRPQHNKTKVTLAEREQQQARETQRDEVQQN